MLRKLIAFAITSGLAKKAWDEFHASRARRRVTDVEAKPASASTRARKSGGAKTARKTIRRRTDAPSA